MKIHTRIAPSPTGVLHVGTARTALINYLYAKQQGGTFTIRSEDTDKARSTKAFEDNIIEGLKWLNIHHDTFVRQSEEVEHHTAALQKLIDDDKAYVSKEEAKNEPGKQVDVVRLRNPGATITFTDLIRGDVTFDTTELGDFVIARAIDDPLYHLAVVVDDHRGGITHVIRGEDHISNTPRQILIQEALGYERPTYAHLPLILGEDRSKLSKRHGAVSVDAYKQQGYLPEAFTNYLALLGWHPEGEEEIFTMEELANLFELERVQKGGAIFSLEKLNWINKHHLQRLSEGAFLAHIETFLPEALIAHKDRLERLLPDLRERVEVPETLQEEDFSYITEKPEYSKESLKFKGRGEYEDIQTHLSKVQELLENVSDWNSPEAVKEALWDYASEVGRGDVLWPLRMALSGKDRSPDPFTLATVFGKEETQKRITFALEKLS